MKPPRSALRHLLGAPVAAAAEAGRRRAEAELDERRRAARTRAKPREGEALPRVLWRSPHLPLFPEVAVRRSPALHKAPPFGTPSAVKSDKMGGRYVGCTSKAERLLVYWCEFDDDVEWYVEQPFSMRYRYGATTARHTVDMAAKRDGAVVAIQAKAIADKAWKEREPWIAAALAALGFTHELRTLADLEVEPRLGNMRRRIDHRRRPAPACAGDVTQFLRDVGPQPLAAVTAALGVSFFDLALLVAHGLVAADVDVAFDEDVVLAC
jgi:hypothetical protein